MNATINLRSWGWLVLAGLMATGLVGTPARAITIDIDYSYDSFGFFNPNTTNGAAARATLNAAADFYSSILDDTFAAITIPPPVQSSISNGVVSFNWSSSFNHPATGQDTQLFNPSIPANQYVIYAGARSLESNRLGIGGPGGWQTNPIQTGTNAFTQGEINLIHQRTAELENLIEHRGENANDFARWGGSITFDRDSSTNWHYNHTTPVANGRSDLYSVAIHELGHSLGLGASQQWSGLVSGSTFTGSAASLENGGESVPLGGGGSHWAEGTDSTVFGTSIAQEAAMDPTVTTGKRKHLTTLDAAALTDIGWTVVAPPGLDGDYNANGIVDAADYTLWRDTLNKTGANLAADGDNNNHIGPGDYNVWKNNFGETFGAGAATGSASSLVPEPATTLMLLTAGLFSISRPRRTRRTF